MSVTGTQQRVYGVLTGGCIIDLHRFALVSGSTTQSPVEASTVTYADTTPYKQCGYAYSGYLTSFLSISGTSVYAAVELRICKNDAKRIVIETYGEVAKTVTGGMSLWFNKGTEAEPDWVKLNSTTSGIIMPYATTSYTFKESKRNGATTIDCCKKCPTCGCKTCNVASRFSAKSINALLFESTCCERIETSEVANFPDPSQLVGREIYIWYNSIANNGGWDAPQLHYKTTIVGVDESGIIMDEVNFIDYLAPPESDQTSTANQSAINRTYTTHKSMSQIVSSPGPSWYYNKCGYGGITFGRYTGRNRASFTIDTFTITGADWQNYLDGTHVALISMYFKSHPETTDPIPNGDPGGGYGNGIRLFKYTSSSEFNSISGMTFDNVLIGNGATLSAPFGLYFAVYFNDGAHGAATIQFEGTLHGITKCNGEAGSLDKPFVCIPYDFEASPVMGETAFLWACFTPTWSLGGINTLNGTALNYPVDHSHGGDQSITYNNGTMAIQYKLNCNTIDIYSFIINAATYYMTYYVDDLGVSNLLSSGFEFDDTASFPFDYLKNCFGSVRLPVTGSCADKIYVNNTSSIELLKKIADCGGNGTAYLKAIDTYPQVDELRIRAVGPVLSYDINGWIQFDPDTWMMASPWPNLYPITNNQVLLETVTWNEDQNTSNQISEALVRVSTGTFANLHGLNLKFTCEVWGTITIDPTKEDGTHQRLQIIESKVGYIGGYWFISASQPIIGTLSDDGTTYTMLPQMFTFGCRGGSSGNTQNLLLYQTIDLSVRVSPAYVSGYKSTHISGGFRLISIDDICGGTNFYPSKGTTFKSNPIYTSESTPYLSYVIEFNDTWY